MGIYVAFMWQMQMKRLTTTMSPASTPPTTNGTVSLLAASVCFFFFNDQILGKRKRKHILYGSKA